LHLQEKRHGKNNHCRPDDSLPDGEEAQAVLAVDADSNACLNEALSQGARDHRTITEESLAKVRSGAEDREDEHEQLFDYQCSNLL